METAGQLFVTFYNKKSQTKAMKHLLSSYVCVCVCVYARARAREQIDGRTDGRTIEFYRRSAIMEARKVTLKQDRQITYNVTMRHVRVTIVAVEKE